MSLESGIADLTKASTDLIATFNGKKNEINKAVADAIAAIPENLKIYHVNQQTGLDTNNGFTVTPLKTIQKALDNTPVGGICRVYVQGDYQLSVNCLVDGRFLTVFSDQSGTRRKIAPAYYLSSDGTVSYMAGFSLTNGGSVMLQDISIPMPSSLGLAVAPSGFTWSFFKTTSNGGTPFMSIKMTSCDVTVPADGSFQGYIVGAPQSAVILEVLAVSFPSGFGGRYVAGIPSGTAPATLSNILTNIPAL
ncbi:hypothetical protein C1886_04735 [Pseudomonas sp. FW300-N1A1]|uniref:hypothetical protein n=1 Tax=Pseudomonas sp. FW300-N1A1 TaxID=2075555 RepID=UPI000CD0BDDC|nr:hypothetical protein [Pseudomonas sp. FW300-N1A1]POA21580.1 hypothetical protein C1886_04735 [Pseudomonas sp. FW300-N1A1]